MKNLKEHLENTIDENIIMEMASVGDLDNNLTIIVRMNDPGNIPHFHIVDKTTLGSKFHTCIKIESAEYFHHTGKEDVLNSKQRKRLVSYLSSTIRNNLTAWEYLIITWNINNSNITVNDLQPMPNYNNLK